MNPSLTGTLRLPAHVHFGYGTRAQLPELLKLHGTRVLAVVDPFLPATKLFRTLLAELRGNGFDVTVYSDISAELPATSLDAAGTMARFLAPDAILAVGGGSTLDAAKLIGLLAAHGGPLSGYYGENAVPGPIVPIVAVPTTAGTGSEVTPVAVVSDPDLALKVGISSPFLIPVAAVVDPEFTFGAPAAVTAFSGIDALVHLVESFTAATLPLDWSSALPVFTGRNIFAETLALQGIATLGTWLPVAVADPENREAREQVSLGALLGGISFGSTGTHLSHALQYPIGALSKTPHGLGTGLLLPYVLDACRTDPETMHRIAAIGTALGSNASLPDQRASDAVKAIVAINEAIGVPRSLREIGITEEQLPHIAQLGMASQRLVAIAPASATPELLVDILTRAFAGTLSNGSPA
ncbi:iron-containing alcohol dehydrogenase [Arthrobacter sp. zg-Y20]|uniref:iron-containing alcohol dehydrogenase n=1 Tax=unclassified Arthrobacter TaxID=235627 RepID=UPI001D138907|nr:MULTISPECIES: iron-containing alcohol dehydrogenase [unclassified Arthrobacter]MCC3274547.1 iron-containing alcohol dehydrogenase [Arthrobacter sp. zg-Y20]MDK1314704.1 iron-containing alcohol dehydrogenase [Arthrobacter sp. zg.Y20]WIB07683.1 iron-containing alcohol dehydrogenase [Arthrobacter sp. zg-Y20]